MARSPSRKTPRRRGGRPQASAPLDRQQLSGSLHGVEQLERREVMAGDATTTWQPPVLGGAAPPAATAPRLTQAVAPAAPTDLVVRWSEAISRPDALSFRFGETPQPGDTWSVLENGVPVAVNTRYYRGLATDTWETTIPALPFDFSSTTTGTLANNPVVLRSGYDGMAPVTAGNRYEIRMTRGTLSAVGTAQYGRFGGIVAQTGTVALLDLDTGGPAPAGVAAMRAAQGEQVAALVLDAGRKITLRVGELGQRAFFSDTLTVYAAKLRVEMNRQNVVTPAITAAQGSNEWTLTIDTAPLAGKSGMVSLRIVNDDPGTQVVAPRYLGVIVKDSAGRVPAKPDWLAVGAVNTNDPDAQNFFRGTTAGDPTGFKAFDTQYIYLNDGPLMRPAAPVTPQSKLEPNSKAWRTASGGIDGKKLVQSLREAAKFGAVPQIVYYNIMTPDESAAIALANLQNRDFLVEYFKDLRFTIDTIRRFASGSTVSLILEPDLLAYMMQSARVVETGKPSFYRDPSTIPAMTEAAYTAGLLPDPGPGKRLPNTLPGFVEAINRGVRFLSSRTVNGVTQAVNLEYGWKFNLWAFDTDLGGNIAKVTDANVLGRDKGLALIMKAAQTTADWYRKAGILTGDAGRTMNFIALDKYGTDGGATGPDYKVTAPGYTDPAKAPYLWNADHWNNYLLFAKTIHESLGKLPVRLWQIPVGHVNGSAYNVGGQPVPDLPNVDKAWEDSATSFFFGDVFTGASAGRDPAASKLFFSAKDDPNSRVSTDAQGRVVWDSHMQVARDSGVESIMFGPGLANSTQGGGYQGAARDGYFWAAKVAEYLAKPTLLRRPALLGSTAGQQRLGAQVTGGTRRANGSTPSAFITVQRTGDLSRPLSLPVRVIGGTAQAGSDYDRARLERTVVAFARGASTALLPLPLLPTRGAQPRETIAVRVGGPQVWLPSLRVDVTLSAAPPLLGTGNPAVKAAAVGRLANQMRAVETFSNPDNPGRIEKQLQAGTYPDPRALNVIGEVSGTNGLGAYPRDGRNTPGAFQVDLANVGIQDQYNPWRETFGEWLGKAQSLKNDSPEDTRIALSRATLSEFFRIEVDAAGLITSIPASAASVFLHDEALATAAAAAWDPAANPLVGQHIDNFREEQLALYLAGRSPADATTGVSDPRRAQPAVMQLAEALQQQVARSFMYGYYQKFQNHADYKDTFAEVKNYFGATLKITASTASFGVKPGDEFWCRMNGSFIVAGTYVRGEGNMIALLKAFVQAAKTGRGTWTIVDEETKQVTEVNFVRVTPAGTTGKDAVFTVDKTPLNVNPDFPSIFHYGAVVSPLDDGVDWNDKAAWGVKDRNVTGGLGYARLGAEQTVTGPAVITQPGRYVYGGLAAGQTLTLSGAGPFYVYGKTAAGGGPVITPDGYNLASNNAQQVGPGRTIDIAAFGLKTPQQVFDATFYGWYDGSLKMAKVDDPTVPADKPVYVYVVPAAGGDPAQVLANQNAFYDSASPYSRSARVAASGIGVLGRPASPEEWARHFIVDKPDVGTGVIDATLATGKVFIVADDTVATVRLGSGSTAAVGLAGNLGLKTYVLNPKPVVGSGARPFLSLRPGDRIDASGVTGKPTWTIDNREQQSFDSKAAAGTPYQAFSAFSRYFATDVAGKRVAEFSAALGSGSLVPDPAAVIRQGLVTIPSLGSGGGGGGLLQQAAPVAEIIWQSGARDGVKGRFYNRTAGVLTAEVAYGDSRESKVSVKPGEYFSFLINEKCEITFDGGSGVYKRVFMEDPYWFGYPQSQISTKDLMSVNTSWIIEGTVNHSEGETNRIDRAPFDLSVKRESDGNRGINGESDGTKEWANFDIYVDSHDAKYAVAQATVTNKEKVPVKVQAYRGGQALGPRIWLAPNASHEFSVPATGTTIEVYWDSYEVPVQVLGFDAISRQNACEVRSSFVNLRTQKPATLTGSLAGVGQSAHLDSPYVGTYVLRQDEIRDPSGGPPAFRILLELHRIPTAPLYAPVSAAGTPSAAAPVAEFIHAKTLRDGVKGWFYNRTAEVLRVEVDLFDGRGGRPVSVRPGEYFSFLSGEKGAVAFRGDSSTVWKRVFMADPGIGYARSVIMGRTGGGSWTTEGSINHSEGETNRIDRSPFDLSVKREDDGNRGIAGEGGITKEWANFDVYVDAHDAVWTEATVRVVNRSDEVVDLQAFNRGAAVGSVVTLGRGAAHVFALPSIGSTIEVSLNRHSWRVPVQILDFSGASRQSPCEVRSTYLDTASGRRTTLQGRVPFGGSARLDAPETGTFAGRDGEVRDPASRPRSLELLLELHKVPTVQMR